MKYYCLLFIIFSILCYCFGENTKKCTENGGYCQYHWDCCSKNCLTYSYKCVRLNQPPILFRPRPNIVNDNIDRNQPSYNVIVADNESDSSESNSRESVESKEGASIEENQHHNLLQVLY